MQRLFFVILILLSVPYDANAQNFKLIDAAKAQIGVTLAYDSRYQRITYPGGDVPLVSGVCTDVVIRAYRRLGIDLQVLVHQDMSKAWKSYPRIWSNRNPDSNIDHRRVPNLATFFKRHGQVVDASHDVKNYLPGDIITWRLASGVPHIGIVSDQMTKTGIPMVIHNIGYGTVLENRLFDYVITGHYRYPKNA